MQSIERLLKLTLALLLLLLLLLVLVLVMGDDSVLLRKRRSKNKCTIRVTVRCTLFAIGGKLLEELHKSHVWVVDASAVGGC